MMRVQVDGIFDTAKAEAVPFEAIEAVTHIDIYHIHEWDWSNHPGRKRQWKALDSTSSNRGKIRLWRMFNYTGWQIMEIFLMAV